MITMEKVCKSYKVAKRNAGFREACKADRKSTRLNSSH